VDREISSGKTRNFFGNKSNSDSSYDCMRYSSFAHSIVGALVIAAIFVATSLQAATVWTGSTITYSQPGTDSTQAANQDRLTSRVWITRGFNGPIFNKVTESFGTKGVSPADTEWATGSLANYNTLVYKDFISWANSPFDTAAGILNVQAVCHLKTDDIYLSVKFTAWGRFGAGKFTYIRSTAAAVSPTPTVSITNLSSGAVFAAPANINIGATASVSSGSVTNVSFYRGTTLIASATTAPYAATASSLPAGAYALTAVATAAGISATSSVVNITVINPAPVTITTPVVSNGQVSFNYSADAGLRYVVQSTSDLSNWSSGSTNVAGSSSVPFNEAVVPNSRFYRVARLPNP
jgi:hypothetical protein